MKIRLSILLVTLAALLALPIRAVDVSNYGILLLAHGGGPDWNKRIEELVHTLDASAPADVAFGMAQRSEIQAAVTRLEGRGVGAVIVVPLFVSSHSSVISATEYLLGVRDEAPPELARFASMKHGHGAHGAHENASVDPSALLPVTSEVPIRWCSPLNDARVVSEILLTRIRSVSTDPTNEVVIVVAHGPVSDEENARWLNDMKTIVGRLDPAGAFHRTEYLTVRDDAPEPIRSEATAELRAKVSAAGIDGKRALVVPLLVSHDGIERGIRKRLEGLEYVMPSNGLVPDPRIAEWVLETAKNATEAAIVRTDAQTDDNNHGASR
ncbi:MAG: hypothetical protein HYU52_14225 [Acidobacteria bacterium]|nr:hypothetical protein [Acidobacteriota bacterium]